MATIKNNDNLPVKELNIKDLLHQNVIKKRFEEILGKKANGFIVSILNTVNSNKLFGNVDPNSILKAALVAASLDLPIDPNLGFAYIIPYGKEAQFQIGYKGLVQLAIRSGQYKHINVANLYDGQFIHYDPIIDYLEYDLSTKNSDEVTHYVAFFKTLNGFEKYYVMSKEEVEKHGKAYSKAYNSSHSPWKSDFDTMAQKTVLKQLISKFGILSIEMQLAQKADQTVVKDVNKDNIDVEYVDNPKKQNEPINIEPLEEDFDSSELFAGYANNKEGKNERI